MVDKAVADKDLLATEAARVDKIKEEQKGQKRTNAFAELMAPKVPKVTKTSVPPHVRRGRDASFRDGLGVYLRDPAALMTLPASSPSPSSPSPNAGRVLYYTDAFVAVYDKFPKSSVHCLLLPRDPAICRLHPVALLNRTDPAGTAFREAVKAAAADLRDTVAADLQQRFGGGSAQDAARVAVMTGSADPPEREGEANDDDNDEAGLPPGRDWAREVLVGVHLRPSMHHVHIHVLSRDMHSDRLRNRKHYNSFTTPFFVPLDAFPLAAGDPRRPPDDEDAEATAWSDDEHGDATSRPPSHPHYLQNDMHCWRCGRDFGNRFQELKRHLDVEFEAWRKE